MKKILMLCLLSLALFSTGANAQNISLETGSNNSDKEQKHCYKKKYFSVHHDHYMKLLVEKHTPGDADKWSAVLQKKNEIREQFKDLKQSDKYKNMKEKWAKNKDKKNHMLFTKDEKKIHMTLHTQFMEAVQAEDEQLIKSILPKLLIEQELLNQKLEAKLAELKKKLEP